MDSYTIKLFYADWCGYCVRFKPNWKKLEEISSKNTFVDKNNKKVTLKLESYEESKNKEIIEKENIQGFPTIKFYKNGNLLDINADSRDTDKTLLEKLNLKINKQTQTGGGVKDDKDEYYEKYIKYKAKYLKLKLYN
jgi:thiol-disulfide isomerase/thioredoxin